MKDDANDNGATIALTPAATMPSTRRRYRARGVDLSLRAPPPKESTHGSSRDSAASCGSGRVPKYLCCRALPVNPCAGLIPAAADARGQSHVRRTILRCAERLRDSLSAQVQGTSSASTGGNAADVFRCTTALRPRAHPCDGAFQRPPPPNCTVQTRYARSLILQIII